MLGRYVGTNADSMLGMVSYGQVSVSKKFGINQRRTVVIMRMYAKCEKETTELL